MNLLMNLLMNSLNNHHMNLHLKMAAVVVVVPYILMEVHQVLLLCQEQEALLLCLRHQAHQVLHQVLRHLFHRVLHLYLMAFLVLFFHSFASSGFFQLPMLLLSLLDLVLCWSTFYYFNLEVILKSRIQFE